MSETSTGSSSGDSPLAERMAVLGRVLGEREADHGAAMAEARRCADRLRGEVGRALEVFHSAAHAAGAEHFEVVVSPLRIDDKHLRAVQFDLSRGRHRAIVTAKSRGDLTLVGPFRDGHAEGPCKSFPFDAQDEIQRALADFLESFLEAAATP